MAKKTGALIAALLLAISLLACAQPEPKPGAEPTASQTVAPAQTSASADTERKPRILIACFSPVETIPPDADAYTGATPALGNTEAVARCLQSLTGGDLVVIRTESDYPQSHDECSEIAHRELLEDARPALRTEVENLDSYDVVFLGYPIWWHMEPMAIRTFLEQYDWSGKKIAPFCTSMGSGTGSSLDDIRTLTPDAEVLEGLALKTELENPSPELAAWLESLDII